jgi:hypothetical protein
MNEVMRFRDNKIGILKNNPGYALDVNGSINSTSLYINEVDINTVVNTLIDDRNYLTIASASTTYLTSSTASSTYATITNLNTKENALTFSAPLTRTTNTISLDLSAYDTIALRNTALSNYLTTATAGTTYATITNLNAKENTLTFSAPLIRNTNTISIDLSSYLITSGGTITGKLSITNGNQASTPSVGTYGGNGERLILYPGSASTHPYCIGIEPYAIFYNTDYLENHLWYIGGSEKMRIMTNGNVGIATDSTNYKLEINGSLKAINI